MMITGSPRLAAMLRPWGDRSRSIAAVAGQFDSGERVDEILARKAAESLGRIGNGNSTIMHLTAADRRQALEAQNALLGAIHDEASRPSPGMIRGSKQLGADMHQWHSGMDEVYGVGSYFYAGMEIPVARAKRALEILERIYAHRQASKMPIASVRHLKKVIDGLKFLIANEAKRPRGNPTGVSVPKAPFYVVATDSFMSGWGPAEGLKNVYVIPAPTQEKAKIALANLKARGEMVNPRIVQTPPYARPGEIISVAGESHAFFTPGAFAKPAKAKGRR